jgi:hypothetical protein
MSCQFTKKSDVVSVVIISFEHADDLSGFFASVGTRAVREPFPEQPEIGSSWLMPGYGPASHFACVISLRGQISGASSNGCEMYSYSGFFYNVWRIFVCQLCIPYLLTDAHAW